MKFKMSIPFYFGLDDHKVEEFLEKEGVEIEDGAFKDQAILAVLRKRVWEELDKQTEAGDKRSYAAQARNQFLGVLRELGLIEAVQQEEDEDD